MFGNFVTYYKLYFVTSTTKNKAMKPVFQNDPYDGLAMARPTSKPATHFGARLAEARKAAGLTQAKLARLLGVSQQIIDYYERRAKNPTTSFVTKAADALSVSVDELLDHETKNHRKPGPPSRLQELTQEVSTLPRTKQRFVIEFLESYLLKSHQRAA